MRRQRRGANFLGICVLEVNRLMRVVFVLAVTTAACFADRTPPNERAEIPMFPSCRLDGAPVSEGFGSLACMNEAADYNWTAGWGVERRRAEVPFGRAEPHDACSCLFNCSERPCPPTGVEGYEASCLPAFGNAPVCVFPCTTTEDCPTGWACFDAQMGEVSSGGCLEADPVEVDLP